MNGYDCEFCHYEHDKRKRKNKTKKRAEAAVMRLAPRATMHAAPFAFGASAAQRSWMYQPPHSAHQSMTGLACSTMASGVSSMLAPPPSLLGHRAPEAPVAYAAPMVMPMQQQPCMQQFVVYGTGLEQSIATPSTSAAMQGAQQFGRHVIQLPPAVSEQASVESKYQAPYPSALPQELDYELSPPPPPPVCPPHLPHICAATQQHAALPPTLPPLASPRLTSRDAAM